MRFTFLIARVFLGLAFLFFGLNGLIGFVHAPPMPPSLAADFSNALMASHYMWFVSAIEIAAAVLLLAGVYVPLALTLLGPIVVNILLFHIFLAPKTILPGVVVTLLWILCFWKVRRAFDSLFVRKAAV
jgi:putative oxidoreductase